MRVGWERLSLSGGSYICRPAPPHHHGGGRRAVVSCAGAPLRERKRTIDPGHERDSTDEHHGQDHGSHGLSTS